jgi:hypothetical protein
VDNIASTPKIKGQANLPWGKRHTTSQDPIMSIVLILRIALTTPPAHETCWRRDTRLCRGSVARCKQGEDKGADWQVYGNVPHA